MKEIVGMNFIESKKGARFMILHLIEDSFFDTVNHDMLFQSDAKTAWGRSTSTEFINIDELGVKIDIVGELRPGAFVRVFKENIDGMDRVTLIQVVSDGKKK